MPDSQLAARGRRRADVSGLSGASGSLGLMLLGAGACLAGLAGPTRGGDRDWAGAGPMTSRMRMRLFRPGGGGHLIAPWPSFAKPVPDPVIGPEMLDCPILMSDN